MMHSSSEAHDTLKKGQWTSEEDAILADYVKKHGEGNWNVVQKNTGLARCGKSCRLRWTNHLRPDLKKGSFTLEEEHKIINLHAQIGNKWSLMAAQLPGRTDNEIKNFWNTRKKKIERAGTSLYHPYSIRPRPLDGNQESSYVDISQGDINPHISHYLKLRNSKPIQEYSSYAPSLSESSMFEQGSGLSPFPMVCPLNKQHNSLYNTCVTSATPPILDQYRGLSGNTEWDEAMKTELPSLQCVETQQGSSLGTPAACSSLPSFNESFEYEPHSPRNNGYLDSIFYPPKEDFEDSNNNDSFHPCNTQWDDPNSTNKQDLSQTDLTNQEDSNEDLSSILFEYKSKFY